MIRLPTPQEYVEYLAAIVISHHDVDFVYVDQLFKDTKIRTFTGRASDAPISESLILYFKDSPMVLRRDLFQLKHYERVSSPIKLGDGGHVDLNLNTYKAYRWPVVIYRDSVDILSSVCGDGAPLLRLVLAIIDKSKQELRCPEGIEKAMLSRYHGLKWQDCLIMNSEYNGVIYIHGLKTVVVPSELYQKSNWFSKGQRVISNKISLDT